MDLKITDFPPGLAGLRYIREDGVVCPRAADEQWLVSLMDDGKVAVSRYCSGLLNEAYAYMPPDQAAVALVAIINGFEPPRSLTRRDTPTR